MFLSFHPHSNWVQYYAHFTDVETDARRGAVTCQEPHSPTLVETGLRPDFSDSLHSAHYTARSWLRTPNPVRFGCPGSWQPFVFFPKQLLCLSFTEVVTLDLSNNCGTKVWWLVFIGEVPHMPPGTLCFETSWKFPKAWVNPRAAHGCSRSSSSPYSLSTTLTHPAKLSAKFSFPFKSTPPWLPHLDLLTSLDPPCPSLLPMFNNSQSTFAFCNSIFKKLGFGTGLN